MSNITLTGLPSSYRIPGPAVQVVLGGGASSSGASKQRVVLIGNKSSAGSADASVLYGPDTFTPLASMADASALFGDGSELWDGIKCFLDVNQSCPVYAMVVAANGVASSANFTISGSATSSGEIRLYRNRNEFVSVGFSTGDGYGAIGELLETAANSRVEWGFTSSNVVSSLSTFTMTMKVAGIRGNQQRFMVKIFGSGITVSNSASTAFSGGSGADDYTAALAALATERFTYIVPATADTTTLGAIKNQLVTQELPINGRRQVALSGSLDSLGNASTQSTTVNHPRFDIVHLAGSDWTSFQMASAAVACFTLQEARIGSDPVALNHNLYGDSALTAGLWRCPAPMSGAKPTEAQISAALDAGLTAIRVNKDGSTTIVKRVTTKTITGSVADYRIADVHRRLVSDFFADELFRKFALDFPHKIVDDNLDENQQRPVGLVTPADIERMIDIMVRQYGKQGLLKNVQEIIAQRRAVRDSNNRNRIAAEVPLQVMDILDQLHGLVVQVA